MLEAPHYHDIYSYHFDTYDEMPFGDRRKKMDFSPPSGIFYKTPNSRFKTCNDFLAVHHVNLEYDSKLILTGVDQ